jgi:general secretion pathway protein F
VRFQLKLFRDEVGVTALECDSADVEQARALYSDQGWLVLSATLVTGWNPGNVAGTRFPLLLFARGLKSLLDAGLTLVECIDALRDKEPEEQVRRILADIGDSLRTGLSLSRALQGHEEIFPALFRAAIEASEQTGEVGEALARFITYEQQFRALRSRLASALVYPLLLAALGGLVTVFLLTYVVPRFSVVFVDRLDQMPLLSSAVIRFGLLVSAHPLLAALCAAAMLATIGFAATRQAVRAWVASHAWDLPGVGGRLRQYQMARLYRSLGLLLRGGIPVLRAMDMVRVLLSAAARAALDSAMVAVREGQTLSVALRQQGLTNSVADRLFAAGERSGRMGEMMERAADFLDEEVGDYLDRLIRLAEPVMMLAIGVIVGGIVMLMYLPIFELAESIK